MARASWRRPCRWATTWWWSPKRAASSPFARSDAQAAGLIVGVCPDSRLLAGSNRCILLNCAVKSRCGTARLAWMRPSRPAFSAATNQYPNNRLEQGDWANRKGGFKSEVQHLSPSNVSTHPSAIDRSARSSWPVHTQHHQPHRQKPSFSQASLGQHLVWPDARALLARAACPDMVSIRPPAVSGSLGG